MNRVGLKQILDALSAEPSESRREALKEKVLDAFDSPNFDAQTGEPLTPLARELHALRQERARIGPKLWAALTVPRATTDRELRCRQIAQQIHELAHLPTEAEIMRGKPSETLERMSFELNALVSGCTMVSGFALKTGRVAGIVDDNGVVNVITRLLEEAAVPFSATDISKGLKH